MEVQIRRNLEVVSQECSSTLKALILFFVGCRNLKNISVSAYAYLEKVYNIFSNKTFSYNYTYEYSNFYNLSTEAPSGIWIDGFEAFWVDWKLLEFSAIQFQNASFYRILSKIDGFENPSLKIDGFGQICWTNANKATEQN